jgi:hypothetical protein
MKKFEKNKTFLAVIILIYLFYTASNYNSLKSSYINFKNSVNSLCVYTNCDSSISIDKIQLDKRQFAHLHARVVYRGINVRQSIVEDLLPIVHIISNVDIRKNILKQNTNKFHGSKYKEECLLSLK